MSSKGRPVTGPPGKDVQLSGELLSAFMALMPDAAVAVDESGAIVAVNERAEALFGYAAGSMVGLAVETLIPERYRQRHRRHRASFAAAPQGRAMGAGGLELTGRRKSGDEFPVDVSLAPVASASGTLVIAAVRDVTVQREATAAQVELATIVQSSVDAIISITPEGRIKSWNPAAARFFGASDGDMVGRHVAELIPAGSSPVFEELLALAVEDGPHKAVDTVWKASDGSEIDVAVSVSPLRSSSGGLTGFSLLVRDVRDRKHAENELLRLLADEERLERQHAATSEIRLVLLSGASLTEALTLVCEHAVDLLDGLAAVISLRDGEELTVLAGSGDGRALVGQVIAASGSFARRVVDAGHSLQVGRRSSASRIPVPAGYPDGPTLGVPVVAGGVTGAALLVVRGEGAAGYSNADLVAGEALAAQAALALELERARGDREQMMLVADRERIARDLHDHVIQQLFATGMWLQGALAFIDHQSAQDRVSDAIESLDDTIREIRNTIYGLLRPMSEPAPLKAQLMQVAKAEEEALGLRPHLEFEGPVDTAVRDELFPHVVAVVREALSNVARHAHASAVSVTVSVEGQALSVTVVDDGIGLKTPVRSSGLANLDERARQLGGHFEVAGAPEAGTRLEWRVPLEER